MKSCSPWASRRATGLSLSLRAYLCHPLFYCTVLTSHSLDSIIGFFIPLPFYLIWRFSPNKNSFIAQAARYINVPVLTLYMGYLPYSVNGQWWSCLVIGFVSQWYMRKRYPGWFVKYNYLLSAALDGGSQVILFILSFAVFGASGKEVPFPYWCVGFCVVLGLMLIEQSQVG